MYNEETAPAVNKLLHADGSITTMAGEVILPADPNRAKEYENRAAAADKWLRPDGSVVDMAGRVILEADESRARDYESRMAGVGAIMPGGTSPGDKLPGNGYLMMDDSYSYLLHYAHCRETISPDIFLFIESENTYLPHYAALRPGEEYVEPNAYPITESASAVLE